MASGGETWTVRYLRGTSAYLELFGSGDVERMEPGIVGLGLGAGRVGDIGKVARHLPKDDVGFSHDIRRRDFAEEGVDWFCSPGLGKESTGVAFWTIEFVADYLGFPAAKKEAAEGGAGWALQRVHGHITHAYK